jgi:hypothetical protein
MTMPMHIALAAVTSLLVGGVALAEQKGETSGPAAGKNVLPTTVIQKMYEKRSSSGKGLPPSALEESGASAASAGYPGVEGKPGTESGQAPPRPSDTD